MKDAMQSLGTAPNLVIRLNRSDVELFRETQYCPECATARRLTAEIQKWATSFASILSRINGWVAIHLLGGDETMLSPFGRAWFSAICAAFRSVFGGIKYKVIPHGLDASESELSEALAVATL